MVISQVPLQPDMDVQQFIDKSFGSKFTKFELPRWSIACKLFRHNPNIHTPGPDYDFKVPGIVPGRAIFPYQAIGIVWALELENSPYGCGYNADETGTGKASYS